MIIIVASADTMARIANNLDILESRFSSFDREIGGPGKFGPGEMTRKAQELTQNPSPEGIRELAVLVEKTSGGWAKGAENEIASLKKKLETAERVDVGMKGLVNDLRQQATWISRLAGQ